LKDTWTPSKEETERHRKNIQRNNGWKLLIVDETVGYK
jgi:hypothetical protein